ncbi:hypothetical protein BKA70DRAFT_1428293 [Coprinopsis sp. MPI-PUGE-AT-0042]|nr:hypothetical protein BKA70DRAFT_1428293 [Coprinopsis sp. MPI-PUGE-AT-0042]
MGDTPNSIFSDITTPVHISGGFFTAGGNNQHIHNARGPVVQWNVSGGQNKFAGNPRKSTPSRSSTSDMNAGQASAAAQASTPAAMPVAQQAQNGAVAGGTVTTMGIYGRTRSAVTRTFG